MDDEPAFIAGATLACILLVAVVGVLLNRYAPTHATINPPVGPSHVAKPTPEPVPYCRAGWNIAVPEAGPNKSVVAFAPCSHVKRDRDV